MTEPSSADRAEVRWATRGGPGIDEHESSDLVGVARGEGDCLGAPEGVADDHVTVRAPPIAGEQCAQLLRLPW